jgi:hypothetical protein
LIEASEERLGGDYEEVYIPSEADEQARGSGGEFLEAGGRTRDRPLRSGKKAGWQAEA